MIGEVTNTVDFSGFITALQSAITPAQLLAILGTTVAAGMLFVLMWFGVRHISRNFISALTRGKFKI